MGRKSRLSWPLVRERISVPRVAPVTTVRVKVVGEPAESRAAAVAERKRRFAKTHAFDGMLPRFDDGLPYLRDVASKVNCLSDSRASTQKAAVPDAARPDPLLAQDPRPLHKSAERHKLEPVPREPDAECSQHEPDHRTTLRVKAVKAGSFGLLWQRQTPLLAFCVAVSLCVLCVLAVNLLAQ